MYKILKIKVILTYISFTISKKQDLDPKQPPKSKDILSEICMAAGWMLLVTCFALCTPLDPQEEPAFITSWQQISTLSLEELNFFVTLISIFTFSHKRNLNI